MEHRPGLHTLFPPDHSPSFPSSPLPQTQPQDPCVSLWPKLSPGSQASCFPSAHLLVSLREPSPGQSISACKSRCVSASAQGPHSASLSGRSILAGWQPPPARHPGLHHERGGVTGESWRRHHCCQRTLLKCRIPVKGSTSCSQRSPTSLPPTWVLSPGVRPCHQEQGLMSSTAQALDSAEA